jgi:hypothetical protein
LLILAKEYDSQARIVVYKSVASAEVGLYTGGSSSTKLEQVQQQNVFV